ncbi:hypothetical protein C8T65DRAFT_704706 [Cerioporus squamosus]|nr:hypothetical protein C8T65DRAFT_704706 [Cerioporus squamosus]
MNPYVSGATAPVSPLMQHATPYPQTSPQQAATIQPGSITYTTTVGADGQVVYHPFNYQTPQGVVSGIQWIPAEATSVLPQNATPADANFAASFNRRTDDRNWRDEDYRRRKDDASRGSNRYDRERERDRYDDDEYYQRQREREEREDRETYRRGDRDRERTVRAQSAGTVATLATQDADLDLERREKDRLRERDRERDRDEYYEKIGCRAPQGLLYGERPTSTYQPAAGRKLPFCGPTARHILEVCRCACGNYPPSAAYHPLRLVQAMSSRGPVAPYRNSVIAPRPSSPYAAPVAPRPVFLYQAAGMQRAASPYGWSLTLWWCSNIQRAASPYQAAGIQRAASPYGACRLSLRGGGPLRSASPYQAAGGGGMYPPGHVLEGQGIGRAASPSPYAPPINLYANPNATAANSPYGGQAPYGNPYGGSGIGAHASPRQQQMLSVPEGFNRPPNRAHPYTQFEMMKIGDMDDFLEHMPRMPAVLMPHDVYHEDWIRLMTDLSMAWAGTMPVPQYSPDRRPPEAGRERRSGRLAGTVDMHLPGFDRFDVSSPSESEDTEDDSAGERDPLPERKAERRKRKMDKKVKKRMKELERSYAVYVQCVPPTRGPCIHACHDSVSSYI